MPRETTLSQSKLCGDSITILPGDDKRTFSMMTNPEARASGVILVISNIAPKAVSEMTSSVLKCELIHARRLADAL